MNKPYRPLCRDYHTYGEYLARLDEIGEGRPGGVRRVPGRVYPWELVVTFRRFTTLLHRRWMLGYHRRFYRWQFNYEK